jgi:hypothetical protein
VQWAAEKREYLRTGLIAATIVNVNRRKGTPLVEPGDFFRERPKESDFMSVEEATREMDLWASSMNASLSPQRVEGLEGNTL